MGEWIRPVGTNMPKWVRVIFPLRKLDAPSLVQDRRAPESNALEKQG